MVAHSIEYLCFYELKERREEFQMEDGKEDEGTAQNGIHYRK